MMWFHLRDYIGFAEVALALVTIGVCIWILTHTEYKNKKERMLVILECLAIMFVAIACLLIWFVK
jgi:hypothetical protein